MTAWQYRKDDVQFSTQRNPTLTFSAPGTYTITQLVKKSCSPVSDAASRTIKVKSPVRPRAYCVDGSPESVVRYNNEYNPGFGYDNNNGNTTSRCAGNHDIGSRCSRGLFNNRAGCCCIRSSVTGNKCCFAPAASVAGTPAPAPAQNTPGTGTLSVATNPAGAQVFVDDVMRGLSRQTFRDSRRASTPSGSKRAVTGT